MTDPHPNTPGSNGAQPAPSQPYASQAPVPHPYAAHPQAFPGQAPQHFSGSSVAPYQPLQNQPYGPPAGYVAPHPYAQVPMTAPKSKVAAALLAFFLGGAGIHRFYLGHTGTGVVMLLMSVLGWMLSIVGIGFLLLIPVGLWALIDFIRILTGGLGPKNGAPMI